MGVVVFARACRGSDDDSERASACPRERGKGRGIGGGEFTGGMAAAAAVVMLWHLPERWSILL